KQYLININASCEMNSEGNIKQIDSQYGNISISDITDNILNSDEPDGAFSNISENVSDTASNPDKKKLQSQGSVQNASDIQDKVNPVINQVQNTEVKIPYNKKVEQDLKRNLSLFIKDNNNKVSEVFDIQILEFSLEAIITGSSKITAQNIADLFIIAMKVRQKEILC
ncbi:3955_t:CDS:2, partial [Racocetra fulgida]